MLLWLTDLLTGHFYSCPTLHIIVIKALHSWDKNSLQSPVSSLIRHCTARSLQNSPSFSKEMEEDNRENTTQSRETKVRSWLSQSSMVETKSFHLRWWTRWWPRWLKVTICPAKVWTTWPLWLCHSDVMAGKEGTKVSLIEGSGKWGKIHPQSSLVLELSWRLSSYELGRSGARALGVTQLRSNPTSVTDQLHRYFSFLTLSFFTCKKGK